ncbi:hypothetical protein COCVIDRAFT_36033 [Bipolaris victoriae FI3]|uniref:Cytochrome P450 n=1 Tax=Bipolaris victoriae (strain FI3) TaxID=930091 RepID=W7EM96_BIPV3|nr:hypothetical protein COCVIDRAFT_36033 [Bipolaris victoriae FI3]
MVIGPREISIYDPSAIQPLLGFSSSTTKGPFYNVMEKSLHLNRDKVFHRQRRRVWDNGMKESLATFSPLVEEFTEKLLAQLHKQNGEPIELLRYCSYYSYDVMSKLAFGDSMGFVEGKQSEVAASILNTFNSSLSVMGLMYHMPWLMNTLGVVTSIAGPMKEWQDWSVSQMKQRIARKDGKADFVGHLIKNTPENTAGLELLYGESRLIISAGSETTSSALTFTLMQLATNPKYVDAIRKEFRDCVSFNCNRPLPTLDAVIQESMRLWPSIFFAPQRVTPPSGLHINSHFIPGNTIVQMPPFATFRDSRNFVKPDEFVPERWTSQPELVLNKNAFIPFSTGPYNCVGKTLANMELRSVIARVVNEFDLRLPDGFVAEQYWDGIKDQFTAGPPAEQRLSFVKCES